MLNWVVSGGKKKVVENINSRNCSNKGKGRIGNVFISSEEVREILCGNDNEWNKGYECSSKGFRDIFDWCYYNKIMCNSKGKYYLLESIFRD